MPTARLRGVAEVATHPVVAELGLLRRLDTSQGEVRMPRAPLHTSAGETGGGAHIPDVGEHTDTWLRRLRYTAAQRRALRAGGAVG
jgi:crotonobetainyl-CoA:carnitine CoA-transferase CaiB-like acyl-CoA transferase